MKNILNKRAPARARVFSPLPAGTARKVIAFARALLFHAPNSATTIPSAAITGNTEKNECVSHTVKEGELLTKIAKQYGVIKDEINKANNISQCLCEKAAEPA
jgi:LysM repeat protein